MTPPIITGDIPNDGYCVSFEYWKRNDGDVRNDHLNDTSECVAVPAHATTVDSRSAPWSSRASTTTASV